MGTTRRLALLAVVACLGCGFGSGGANNAGNLGSSASGTGPTTGTDATEGDSTGSDTVDAATAEGETSFGGSTSVGSDESCVDSCMPQVPAGWQGPFYAADAANPIECPAGYPQQDQAFTGLQAEPATCGCTCDVGASSCRVDFVLGTGDACIGLTFEVGDGECTGLNTAGVDVHARPSVEGSPASCTPNISEEISPPQWETTTTFCAAPARGGDCGDDRCTALPPEGVATRYCVAKDGEEECPAGDFNQRTVLHREVNDQRTCTDCNCQGQAECVGQAFAHDSGVCSDSPQSVPFNTCTDINVSGNYGIAATFVPGSCQPTQANAAGEAVPTSPITVCCES